LVVFGAVPIVVILIPTISSAIVVSASCAWTWSIYMVSSAKAPQDSQPNWTRWIFLAPPSLVIIGAAFGLLTPNSPTSVLMLGTLLLGSWRAAQALEYADQQGKPITAGRIAGTMLLMVCALVGVWWLRQRILRVASLSPE